MRFIKCLAIFTLLLLASGAVMSQDYSTSNKKAIKQYEQAQQDYELFNFDIAETSLLSAIEKDSEFIEAYILLSQLYSETKKIDEAIEYLEKAVNIDPGFYPTAFYFLAEMQLSLADYNNASQSFKSYLKYVNDNSITQRRAILGLNSCEFAIEAMAHPYDFDPLNLGPNINSKNPEYFPCITADNETLLYTRLVKNSQALSGKHEDFYVSNKTEGEWQMSSDINEVNTFFNEGAPTLSPDGQILIFTACEIDGFYGENRNGKGSCDLFYSSKVGIRWSQPQNLGEKVNTYYWETQPSFSADGRTLYFVRGKRTRNGVQQQDIYVSSLNREGQWQKATKIKGAVNTEFEEESVMIHPDGKTLYFSSNGHPGMGGTDIFMSKMLPNGEWGVPVNLGYPINTSNNENSIMVAADGKLAYFASNREGGYGDMDLYSFILPEHAQADEVTYMKGLVLDSKSYKKLEANFELIDLESGNIVANNYSNPKTGEFLVCLPTDRDYALNVSKEGFLFYSDNFSLKGYKSSEPFFKEILLDKLRPGAKIVLKNVFFNTNEFDLDNRSHIELDKLVKLLEINPSLKCEISGHTDNVGDVNDNRILSENRAKSVVDYLTSQGIDEERLSYKGLGESVPVATNDTKEGRSLNRRTEFKIIE